LPFELSLPFSLARHRDMIRTASMLHLATRPSPLPRAASALAVVRRTAFVSRRSFAFQQQAARAPGVRAGWAPFATAMGLGVGLGVLHEVAEAKSMTELLQEIEGRLKTVEKVLEPSYLAQATAGKPGLPNTLWIAVSGSGSAECDGLYCPSIAAPKVAGGHYVIKRRFQFKRAQRYIRSQLFPSTFG
jgi:hypothetical protein